MSDDKPTNKIRDRYIQIRLTDTEFNDIKTRAGELGTSTFLRQLALGQKIEQPKAKAKKIIHAADPELVRHVAWIGNNINQIAHKVNSKRFFFGNFNSVIEGQRKIYDAILNLTGDDS